MKSHEAAALVRQWATEGEISRADQGRAVNELERLLVERAKMEWHLSRLVGPWRQIRAVLDELAEVAGEGQG